MKVLVTGGSGLLGHALQIEAGFQSGSTEHSSHSLDFIFATSGDADLRCEQATRALLERERPEVVVHLAAQVGGLFKNQRTQGTMLSDNLRMNENVMRLAGENNVRLVICCLSTCIFPEREEKRKKEEREERKEENESDSRSGEMDDFTEDDIHDGPPHSSNYGYAYAKRILHIQARAYGELFPWCQYVCIVPTNVYGPFDNYCLRDAHVLPALIHKCWRVKERVDERVSVKGTGKPQRQFVYSRDVARVILLIIHEMNGKREGDRDGMKEKREINDMRGRRKDEPDTFIIAPNQEISIAQAATLIASAMNIPSSLIQVYRAFNWTV